MSETKVYGPIGEIRPFLDSSITTHYLSAIPDQVCFALRVELCVGCVRGIRLATCQPAQELASKPKNQPPHTQSTTTTTTTSLCRAA